MTLHAKTRWPATFVVLALAALAPARYRLHAPGLVLVGLLAAMIILAVQRMRFSADDSGVTAVNLLRARRVAWSEISDFRLGRIGHSTCLDVCRQDGTRMRAWAVTTTGLAAHPQARVDDLILELRQRLMLANGWSQEDLDARAIDDALTAADGGEFRQASALVAEGRVESQAMAERLVERAKERPK
jgi:hypothetical protein